VRAERVMACLVTVMVLASCAGPVRKNNVPKTLTTQAGVPGWPTSATAPASTGMHWDAFMREGIESFFREQTYLASRGYQGPLPPAVYLAVSGGGDNGAFGAGLLNG
jgi:hypothetical protein